MNADKLIADLRSANPTLRFAKHANGNMIGEWTGQGFSPIIAKILTGQWVYLTAPLPLANGQRVYNDCWEE